MKFPPFFPIYPADLLSDDKFAFLSHRELGACLILMCWQWQNGSIPTDEARLTQILRRHDNSDITDLLPTFKRVFDDPESEPGTMRNSWLNSQRLQLVLQRSRKALGGRLGMQSRWGSDKTVITDGHNNITKHNKTEQKKKDIKRPPSEAQKVVIQKPTAMECEVLCASLDSPIDGLEWHREMELAGWEYEVQGKKRDVKNWKLTLITWTKLAKKRGEEPSEDLVHRRRAAALAKCPEPPWWEPNIEYAEREKARIEAGGQVKMSIEAYRRAADWGGYNRWLYKDRPKDELKRPDIVAMAERGRVYLQRTYPL